MKWFCLEAIKLLESFKWLPLLLFRLILAYGFWMPAMEKLKNFHSVVQWFESLNIPFPQLSAIVSSTIEVTGIVLLLLGLCTRLICIPLMFMMVVAIFFVHWNNGFTASSNGFEIPLYYFLMLFALLVFGPGGISIDAKIKKNWLMDTKS